MMLMLVGEQLLDHASWSDHHSARMGVLLMGYLLISLVIPIRIHHNEVKMLLVIAHWWMKNVNGCCYA